jgi:hypothetical protein
MVTAIEWSELEKADIDAAPDFRDALVIVSEGLSSKPLWLPDWGCHG